jgi:hypothetical protein
MPRGKASRELRPDQIPDVADVLEWYLEHVRGTWEAHRREPYDGWRVSALGSCLRAQIMRRRGEPPTRVEQPAKRAKRLRTFAWGDSIHGYIRLIYWRLGLIAGQEIKVEDEDAHVRGHIDAILDGRPRTLAQEPEEIVAEWTPEWAQFIEEMREEFAEHFGIADEVVGDDYKSTHTYAARMRKKEGASEGDFVQVGGYWWLSKIHPEQVPLVPDRWRVAYIPKDADERPITFDVPEAYIGVAEGRVIALNRSWEKGDLPRCECIGTWRVGYCDYAMPKGEGCCGVTLLDHWKGAGSLSVIKGGKT